MTELNTVLPALKPFLQTAWQKSGFEQLSSVQERTLSKILEGKDVIVESPTGTGKTLAYLLPLLQQINVEVKQIQAVILAPSKELAMQILTEIQAWAASSGIQSASFIGGANVKRQVEKLKKHPQIVVGTPGRMLELIKQKKMKMHEVKTIVLDEGDQLLLPEHSDTVFQIIKTTKRERQLLLFSATLNEATIQKAREIMNEPELVLIKEEKALEPVEHIYFVSDARDKIEVLRKLSRIEGIHALVFLNGRWDLSVLVEKLKYKGISVSALYRDLNKAEREKAIRLFQNGEVSLLLATDVAARGLHIPNITHVVHFDLADSISQYIHRSGRTGRLGTHNGKVVSIVTPREESQLKKYARERKLELKKKQFVRGNIVDVEKSNR
ncbi:DEAD/DEAH box helicase [Heyndrickxia ginsengihumi]|uniref:DEAD/DEAH box helicase n=1 Tax=Heyndrickxia ginsengihumi TaxID=363870 RepID=UPI00046F54A8|nr:DEAD/DEAH box helicase [Heyndrickxia ginsengihumi]